MSEVEAQKEDKKIKRRREYENEDRKNKSIKVLMCIMHI